MKNDDRFGEGERTVRQDKQVEVMELYWVASVGIGGTSSSIE